MTTENTKSKRQPRRAAINGTRNVLTIQGKDPNYVYRIVNDSGDRINQMKEIGYEIVTDKGVKVGDRRVANPTQEGAPVKVSVGGGLSAYVMRIPKEFYQEDQDAKMRHIAELESSMKKEARDSADYGKITVGND